MKINSKTGVKAAAKSGSKQPTLAQLRAFAAVAEHLHFRDAAAAIGMSQPALSGAVSALEEAVGVQLLERTTRKVLLSPAGERIAARAKMVLDAMGELMKEAEAVRAPFTGVLRLGVIPTVAPYLLPTVLGLFQRRYPLMDLQVHEEQTASLLEGLTGGRLDLLLLAVPLGVPGVTEMPVFDEEFVLLAPGSTPSPGARTSRARRCASSSCCCSTRGTACGTRPWTSAARPDGGRARTSPRPPPGSPPSSSSSRAAWASPCCRARRCGWRPPATSTSPPGTSPSPPPRAGSHWRCGRARPGRGSSGRSRTRCARPSARSRSGRPSDCRASAVNDR